MAIRPCSGEGMGDLLDLGHRNGVGRRQDSTGVLVRLDVLRVGDRRDEFFGVQIHVLRDHLDDLLEGPLPLEPEAAVLVVLLHRPHHVARFYGRRLARALEARFQVRSLLLGRGDGRIQRIVGGLL